MLKNQLLEYVNQEKKIIVDQIELLKSLPEDVQIEKGFLVVDLLVVDISDNDILFSVEVNNSKLKAGDPAILILDSKKVPVTIIENLVDQISVTASQLLGLPKGYTCKLQISIPQLLDPIIECFERLEEGAPGWHFLQLISGIVKPQEKSVFQSVPEFIVNSKIDKLDLSEAQKRIIYKACQLPSFLGIQGPPGTGKSYTLSVIADILHSQNKRIVIVAHTHQAVNNCLEAIHAINPNINLVKIGEKLKSIGLPANIETCTFSEFNLKNKSKKRTKNPVVGMTIYSAILNLGLRRNSLSPNILLVDEAGQIPLSMGSLIGYFGAGSNLFFGDDAQMPPIFHEEMISNPLSLSVFQQIRKINPNYIDRLEVTYRMNQALTSFIGRNFYKDSSSESTFLSSSASASHRVLDVNLAHADSVLTDLFDNKTSLSIIPDDDNSGDFKYYNPIQAKKITNIVDFVLKNGLSSNQIAIVTPYRKQVNEIRKCLNEIGITDMPIVDTVERVQGITVEMVIFSVCATNKEFLKSQENFIFSPNRINVAISRAKTKAIIFGTLPYSFNL